MTGRVIYTKAVMEVVHRMLGEGATNLEIADAIGATEHRVASRLHHFGIRRDRRPTKPVYARVPVDIVATYAAVASARNMRPHKLLRAVIENVAMDNLFTAVLDDE